MKKILLLIAIVAFWSNAYAYKMYDTRISIGDTLFTPHAEALLDLGSTTKGFLPPRMTEAERDAMTNVVGMTVFNTDTGKLEYNDGGAWVVTGLAGGGLTQGSVLFASPGGTITEDNTNLFWDDTSNILRVGNGAADTSSIFETFSTTKGTRPCPSMTLAQRDAIVTPASGLCVYNSDTNKVNIYDGSTWGAVGGGLDGWVTATPYVINDVVHESEKLYRALTVHTSGTFATDLGNNDWIELSDDLNRETSVTDDAVARWDGAGGDDVQNSLVIINDTGQISGATQLDVGNLQLTGNNFNSTAGNIVINPVGSINLPDLTISQPAYIDASGNLVSQDLSLTADVSGLLPAANGGTGIDSSALTGIPALAAGVWSISTLSSGISTALTDETGTGLLVFNSSPTIVTPTIASFVNANHDHEAAAGGGQLDHGLALTGLSDDDHTQYALLAGRAGGQSLTGGTAAGEDLTFSTTSDITKGTYFFPDLTASQFVKTDGASGLTTAANIDLATADVTGTLPIANGGTNSSAALANSLVMESVGGAIVESTTTSAELDLLNGRTYIPDAVGVDNQVATFNGINSVDSDANFTNNAGVVGITGSLAVDQTTINGSTISTDAATDLTIAPGTTGLVTLNLQGGQEYDIEIDGSNTLSIQGQTAATASSLSLFSADGDATDFASLAIYGSGVPDGANEHFATLQWDATNTQYELQTGSGGTGNEQDLSIFAGAGNLNQLFLDQGTGNVSIKGSGPTNSLEVTGAITNNGLGLTPSNLLEDGSFEDGTDSWVCTSGACSTSTTAADQVHGLQTLNIDTTATVVNAKKCFTTTTPWVGKQAQVSCEVKTSVTDLELCSNNDSATTDESGDIQCASYGTTSLDEFKKLYARMDVLSGNEICVHVKSATTNTDKVILDDCKVGNVEFQTAELSAGINTFTAKVSIAGVVSSENEDFISGNCSLSASTFTCTYVTSKFSESPVCSVDPLRPASSDANVTIRTSSATTLEYRTEGSSTGIATDLAAEITCTRAGDDFKEKSDHVITPTTTTAPASSYSTTAGSFSNTTDYYLDLDTVSNDPDGLYTGCGSGHVTTQGTGCQVVAPRSGTLHASTYIRTASDSEWGGGENLQVIITKNGSDEKGCIWENPTTANTTEHIAVCSASGDISVVKGDVLEVKLRHSAGAGSTIVLETSGGKRDNYFDVHYTGSSADISAFPIEQFQTKALTIDKVNVNETLTDLTFSNLVIGNCYEAYLQAQISLTGTDAAIVSITHDGNTEGRVVVEGNNLDSSEFGITAKFIATATTLTFVTSSFTNATLAGSGDKVETYARLTEKQCREVTKF